MKTYRIIRFFSGNTPSEVIEPSVTLEEAQEHCNNPETSGTLATGEKWFDGYQEN